MTSIPTATVRKAAMGREVVLLDARDNVLGYIDEAGTLQLIVDGGPSTRGFHFYESFIRCPRLYAMHHHLGIGREDAPPLVKGTLGHLGVAQWRARNVAKQRGSFRLGGGQAAAFHELARPLDAMRVVAQFNGTAWTEHLAEAKEGVVRYARKYEGERMDVVFIEEEMQMHVECDEWLSSPFLYTQRGDWGSRDPSGRVRLHDVKCIQRYRSTTMDRYKLSGQMLGYVLFGQKLWGEAFAGVVVDFIELSGNAGIHRKTWPWAPVALERYTRDLAYWERSRRELDAQLLSGQREADDYPGKWSEFACNTPYGMCPGSDPRHGATCARGFSRELIDGARARLAKRNAAQ